MLTIQLLQYQILESFQQMTFKQKYLCQSGPFPYRFQQERSQINRKINQLFRSCSPNQWYLRSISPIFLIESMKQVYGLQAEELASFMNYFLELLKSPNISGDTIMTIMKTLNRLKEFKIDAKKYLKVDNQFFFNYLKDTAQNGCKYPLKSMDSFLDDFMRIIRYYAQFGEDCIIEVLDWSITKRQNKYLALFIRSIKTESNAALVLEKIFAESSIWDRDGCFFYIIAEITKKFQKIDYSPYHQTLFHEIIKIVTIVIDPNTEDDIKKIIHPEPSLALPAVIKCIADILVNILRPISTPGWKTVWSCIQRIFSLISSTLDHSKQAQFMNDFLIFFKQFTKTFQLRYRTERKIHQAINEDYIEEYHGEPNSELVFNQDYLALFDSLWIQIIPSLLYLEDNEVRVSKILYDLIIFNPKKYLSFILSEILNYLEKDLTIVSLYSSKMTVLFVEEFVFNNYQGEHQMTLLLQCCSKLLVVMEKLGVSENLDILQLVMRCFLHIHESFMDNTMVQGLVEDILNIIVQNMNVMSINLETNESEEAEIYFDFRNIYLPFILRLNKQQVNELCDKILYKIKNSIPQNKGAYEFIISSLSFMNKKFSKKVLDFVFKELITDKIEQKQQQSNSNSHSLPKSIQSGSTVTIDPFHLLPLHPNHCLHTSNEEHLKWYSTLIQCAYQYNPDNVVEEWNRIEIIITVMIREWQKNNIFDWGLDILFNIIINLCNVHLPPDSFKNDRNRKYETLKNIQWTYISQSHKTLLKKIKKIFYDDIQQYVFQKYTKIVETSEVCQKIASKKIIQIQNEDSSLNIKVPQSYSALVDALLISEVKPSLEQLAEKKGIFKIISIQYTVFSALQQKCPYLQGLQQNKTLKDFFIPEFVSFRIQAIPYLKFIKQLLCHFNAMSDSNILKTYHFFWREAHDQFYFSTPISATNQKLLTYYYPHVYKKKEIFSNPYLIIAEIYVTSSLRISLHSSLSPVAYLNNKQYFDDLVPMSISNNVNTNLQSLVPLQINVHKSYHQFLFDIIRLKFSLKYQQSYINKYIASEEKGQKQRYLHALRLIILNIRKNLAIFDASCCYQDQALWNMVIEILEIYPHLEKKGDKSVFSDILYFIILFTVDIKGVITFEKENKSQNQAIIRKNILFVQQLIKKVDQKASQKMQKSTLILAVLIMCIQDTIPLTQEIHLKVFQLVTKMCTKGNDLDQNNIGKTILYHIINKVLKTKIKVEEIQNIPIKRSFNDFMKFRYLGGAVEEGTVFPASSIKTQKTENYFYPLKKLQSVKVQNIDLNNPLEKLIFDYLTDESFMNQIFSAFISDLDLKLDDRNEDMTIGIEDEPKKVSQNGYKILNFLFDANPKKLDIFTDFVQNFSSYPTLFYHKLYRKMMLLGKKPTVQIIRKIITKNFDQCEKQQKKMRQYLMAQLLPYLMNDQEYIQFYSNWLATCSNQQFSYSNNCILVVFCIDWKINIKLYHLITKHLQQANGRNRLRLLQVLNNFVLCTGRFGRKFAIDGIEQMLQGVAEGTDEISELIVSMLISCFIIPINFELFPQWVQQPLQSLLKQKRLCRMGNTTAAYQIDSSLQQFLKKTITQCEMEKQIASKHLKTYSKIVNKILSSITVYRFNDSFYNLLKETMLYFLNKTSPASQGSLEDDQSYEDQIVSQLRQSEYPQHIYQDIIGEVMVGIQNERISIIKKKLKFLEGVVINHGFVTGNIVIPLILGQSQLESNGFDKQNGKSSSEKKKDDKQKNIILEHIIAVSNMIRILKNDQLSQKANLLLSTKRKDVNMMMAVLLAAGTRSFDWRQKLLNQILHYKKLKLVKQFISFWWKGRSPQTEEQQRLYMLVRSVENPYSYFA